MTKFVVQENTEDLVLPFNITRNLSDDESLCWFVCANHELVNYNPIVYFDNIFDLHDYIYEHGWTEPEPQYP